MVEPVRQMTYFLKPVQCPHTSTQCHQLQDVSAQMGQSLQADQCQSLTAVVIVSTPLCLVLHSQKADGNGGEVPAYYVHSGMSCQR